MITPGPPWRLRDGFAAAGSGIVASGIAAAAVASDGVSTLELFALVLPVQSLTTLGVVFLLSRGRGPLRDSLSLRGRWVDLVGIPVGAGVQLVLSALALAIVEAFFGGDVPGQEVVNYAGATAGALERGLAVAGLVVVGPVAEEVVFRGIILPALLPKGRRRAVIISSALFAALHLVDPRAVFSVPFLFVLALVLANETLRTGRLGRAIAIHAGFNLVTVIGVFLIA